jgi:hypothetical protein
MNGNYKMIQPGIYPNLSNSEYHGDENSFSRTALMKFNRSPYHYWAHYISVMRPPSNLTKQLLLGRAFHEYVLEPEEFKKHFRIKPTKVYLKNVGRELYDIYKAECEELENSNYLILEDDEMYTILQMVESLKKHPEAREILMDGVYEQSYFWQDPESGLMVKARPDIVHPNFSADLKTASDASPKTFEREIYQYGYHIQAAMVEDARAILEHKHVPTMINIAVETSYPYSVAVYPIAEEAVQIGRENYKNNLLELKRCIAYNEWPGYEIQTLGIPRWAM